MKKRTKIGSGSDRDVFDLGDHVIKISNCYRGDLQCEQEWKIWKELEEMDTDDKFHFVKIHRYGRLGNGRSYVIMDKVTPLAEACDINEDEEDVLYFLEELGVIDDAYFYEDLWDELEWHFGLHSEIADARNLGVNSLGDLVILDYGFSHHVTEESGMY